MSSEQITEIKEKNANELVMHLVSDSTGETASSVCRAAVAQFDGVKLHEQHWTLIRTPKQMERVLDEIEQQPGMVLYTVVDPVLRKKLTDHCAKLRLPCLPVLSRVVNEISHYLGVSHSTEPGRQYALDDHYFSRIEAVNFALAHDDGQMHWDLHEADVILIGASRSSKTPTCIYLAYRGYFASNIPYVHGCPLPPIVEELAKKQHQKPMLVGLTIQPDQLVQIRKNRLVSLKEERETNYVDEEQVKTEIRELRRLFTSYKIPVIDVSRRSVEETAATIMQMLQSKGIGPR